MPASSKNHRRTKKIFVWIRDHPAHSSPGLELRDKDGRVIEGAACRVGFRIVEIKDGRGLLAEGGPVLEFSALPYTAEDLTQESRGSKHPVDVPKRGFSCLTLDHVQMGVGGDAGSISSGELVHVPEFRLASDRKFWVIATV